MVTLESQLASLGMMRRLQAMAASDPAKRRLLDTNGFAFDVPVLTNAVPFDWSPETIDAVLAASAKLPADAALNSWNLTAGAVWWYFDRPLPFVTVHDPAGVRALSAGWAMEGDQATLVCSTWIDQGHRERHMRPFELVPSQSFGWRAGETVETLCGVARAAYLKLYGPGGMYEELPQIGVEAFVDTTELLSRFIVSGMSWLNQRVLVTDDGEVERHRRKAFEKETGRELRSVKVVSLRRLERHGPAAAGESAEERRAYACRFVVEGHWRNQRVGPGRAATRLTWVHPYIKGPDDKPLRVPEATVYAVRR